MDSVLRVQRIIRVRDASMFGGDYMQVGCLKTNRLFPTVAFLMVYASVVSGEVAQAQIPAASNDPVEHTLQPVVVESNAPRNNFFNPSQSVAVLSDKDLEQKSKSSLGDTLASEPGVSSSSFGPGAGRPIIRGLGGDRIRILENGVSTLDASNISPDHAVTIESTLVDRMEVLRGPAALLYGTSALGGVVNVYDRRIAEKRMDKPVSATIETRAESVDRSRMAVAGVDTQVENFVFHVDGFKRRSNDIDIPGFARMEELRDTQPLEYPEPRGTLPFSDTDSNSLTLGSSYLFSKGFLGAAVSQYDTRYGVPNGEPDISIDARRQRLDVRGGVKETGEWISSAIARVGIVDYDHTEYEGAIAGTKYKQNGFDGRVDFTHAETYKVRGTWGFEVQGSSVEAIGEEAFQPPTDTSTYSLFALEEIFLSDSVTWQLGARIDWNSVQTSGFSMEADDDQSQYELPSSQSTGVVWDFAPGYDLTVAVAHTERAPNGQELFADGPHAATGVYEIGDNSLGLERSWGSDVTLRKKAGAVRGFVGGFYTRYWDYVSLNPSGGTKDDLPVYQFEALGADFFGFESQVAFFLEDKPGDELSIDVQPDYLWARDRDNDQYLPRIAPLRIKAGINYDRRDLARIRLEVQQVLAQHRTAEFETPTDGYTMLNLYLSKDVPAVAKNLEVFARGSNLLGEKARNHVSFIKDVAPLPGASAMLGFRLRF